MATIITIRYYPNGIPTKNTIIRLIEEYGVDPSMITFSESYREGRRVGILFRSAKVKEQMKGFDQFLKDHTIEVKRVKEFGVIHSIWLHSADISGKDYICVDD